MPATIIDQIFELFEQHGEHRYGEDATQLSHALQCAALARAQGCADTLVAAALLHDIGQFIDDAGTRAERFGDDARHEAIGAALLSDHFPADVTEPIRLHVGAKRFLCAIESDYAAALSPASRLSLKLQGGAMNSSEAAAFRQEPYFAAAVQLRRFDDAGKQPDLRVAPLASYRPLLESLVR